MGLVAQTSSAQASQASSAAACNISGVGPPHDGAAAALAPWDLLETTPRENEALSLSPLHLKDPSPSSKDEMESILCPISHEVMIDPVMAMDG